MKGRRYQPGEIACQRAECRRQEPASGAERDSEQAGGDQGECDPEQGRRDEGIVVHRGGQAHLQAPARPGSPGAASARRGPPRAPGAGGRDKAAARGAGGFGRSARRRRPPSAGGRRSMPAGARRPRLPRARAMRRPRSSPGLQERRDCRPRGAKRLGQRWQAPGGSRRRRRFLLRGRRGAGSA